jgi:hypothetical protein
MTITRESMARRMFCIAHADNADQISDEDWRDVTEAHAKRPGLYPSLTAAYAQADLALSLAIEHAEAQQALLPPWTPAMQQVFGAWLKVAFPHELDSKSIMSLGDAWQAGWEVGHFNEMLARPAQREPAGDWDELHALTKASGHNDHDAKLILFELHAAGYSIAPHPPATSERAAVLEDSLYIAGIKVGWNFCIDDDHAGYQASIEPATRLPNDTQEG